MAQALAAMGLLIEVDDEVDAGNEAKPTDPADVVCLWPCNVPAWNAWCAVSTQWRSAGLDGMRTGLDYTAVLATLRHGLGLGSNAIGGVFASLRAMEQAALEEWRAARERAA